MRIPFACLPVVLSIAAMAPASTAHATVACNTLNGSQAALNQCYGDAYKKSDAELNALYRQVETRLKDDAATVKLLVTAQKAWVAFRDAECDFSTSGAAQGSIHPMILAICLDELTRVRIKNFRGYLNCQEGDMSCPVPAR